VTDREERRAKLQSNCQVMRKLLPHCGNLPVLQEIGAIAMEARREMSEEQFLELVDRYGMVFSSLGDRKVITPEIYEQFFV
jgi:hypothetical protein